MKIKYVIIKELEWEVSTDGFFVEKLAIQVLNDEAERIKRLIRNQNNSLCISQCKAFEEVVDTQMYGFSPASRFCCPYRSNRKERGPADVK